jgi:hypothetical protein
MRIWAMGTIYGAVLLGGLIPLALLGLLAYRLMPVLSQPALLESVLGSLQATHRTAGTVLVALGSGAGQALVRQPAYVGWMLVMAGIIFLWGGVYRRLTVTEA